MKNFIKVAIALMAMLFLCQSLAETASSTTVLLNNTLPSD